MSLVGRLLSSRRTLTESESRETERRALINDLTVQNARYGVVQVSPEVSSGYASSTMTIPIGASTPPVETGTSWYVSVFLVVNAALGAGLLNFPHAFHAAGGVVSALSVQIVLLAFACSTLVILAYCADANKSPTYQDVIKSCLGSKFHLLCSFCIAVYCYGSCITFLIVIGDQFDRFFWNYDKNFCHVFYMNRPFTTIVSSVLFVLPFCYPKRIDFLKYASAAGVVAIFYIDALQVWKYYTGEYAGDRGEIKHGPNRWTDVFLVAPTIFFGYQCHISAVPIYHCLEARSAKSFLKTVLVAMVVLLGTYSIAAVYGYLTFGGNVSDDILQNYDPSDPWVLIAMLAITFKTFTSYPLLTFCGRAGIDSLWVKLRGLSGLEQNQGERLRRVIQATIWFVSSVAFALLIPGINVVISFLGALAAAFIVVFPGLCLIKLSLDRKDAADGKLLLSQTSQMPPSPRKNEGEFSFAKFCLFFGYGVLLVVLGMFIFGIIVTNSCTTKTTKLPLCV